jgi:hypothetical protein
MTFKEELMAEYTQAQMETLKERIQVAHNSGHRHYKVLLTKVDFKRKYLFSYQLMGYGKVMWDQLLQLGFTPRFTSGGDWSGGPGLWVEW